MLRRWRRRLRGGSCVDAFWLGCQNEAKLRRERLKQVLALQRKLGHFEASRELSELVSEQKSRPAPRAPFCVLRV